MGFISTLKQGQMYLKTWPLHPKLGGIFPENRIIKTTLFAQKFMPFVAVFAVVWQQIYAKTDFTALAIAVLTAIFALMIPLQGLYWLGKRAKAPLPQQTCLWFEKICGDLAKINEPFQPSSQELTYQDLAILLKKAQAKLDENFWQDL